MDLFFPFPSALPSFGYKQGEQVKAPMIKVMDLQRKERLEGLKFTAKPGPEMTLFLSSSSLGFFRLVQKNAAGQLDKWKL